MYPWPAWPSSIQYPTFADWNGPRCTLPRLTSPMNGPLRRKIPKPYAASKCRWRSHAPHRGLERVGVGDGVGRPRLAERLPRLEPVATADAHTAPRLPVARLERPELDPRTMQRRPTSAFGRRLPDASLASPACPTETRCPIAPRPAGLARPRDDRARRRPPRHRRGRVCSSPTPPSNHSTTASTSSCTSPRRARRRWTTTSARCTPARGCSRRSRRPTWRSPTPGQRALAYLRGHVRAGRRAHVRELDRRRPPLPPLAAARRSTSTSTTAASTCRRSRSSVGAGTPRPTASVPSKNETHRALDDVLESIAELALLPRVDAPSARLTRGGIRRRR